jgi:hypothetical protein
MRFYFAQPGEPLDEGIDLPNAEVALREATDAALAMAREILARPIRSASTSVRKKAIWPPSPSKSSSTDPKRR